LTNGNPTICGFIHFGQLDKNDIMKNTEEKAAGNRRLAKKRVQCLYEVLCFVSSAVLTDSFVLRNPLLRQAPKRYEKTKTGSLESLN